MSNPYLQRAELLANLGRYEDALEELEQAREQDADRAAAQTLLARVRLASGDVANALSAADEAVKAAPTDVAANVARGMVLAELGRIDEAADQAERILRYGRGDGYACTSAAAILGQVRAGQVALDAAWEGVRLAPDQPRAHLVLGVVAARLGMDDIAVRAYHEALQLDPELETAETAVGLSRQEQHRYVQALARVVTGRRRAETGHTADRPVPAADPLRRLLDLGASSAVVAVTVVSCLAGTSPGSTARLWAAVSGVAMLGGFAFAFRRLPIDVRGGLPERMRADRALAVAVWAVVAAPLGLVCAAVSGSSWLLLGASAAAVVALFANRFVRS